MEIVPGVHLVEGVRGANVYLLADEWLTLVDTGLPRNGRRILTYITGIGRDPLELKRIILTHSHPDHAGSAAELRRLTGAEVLAHPAEVEVWGDGQRVIRPRVRARRAWLRRFFARSPTPVGHILSDGEVIPCLGGLRIIHTPGHSPGGICLYLEQRRVLFVGDLIINHDGRLSRPLPHPDGDPRKLEESLQKLAQLEVEVCCFAHGQPLVGAAAAMIKEFATHRPHGPAWWRLLKYLGRRLWGSK